MGFAACQSSSENKFKLEAPLSGARIPLGLVARWETSVGNIEEARVTFDVIARAIDDAVYLDEEAYREIAPTMQFTKVIRVSSI